jgi:thiaminase/transcriptional activator TenA
LVQDYLFVIDFVRMAGRLLAAAPAQDFDTLLSGLAALKAELLWFREKAAERHLDLTMAKHPTCLEYCGYMSSLALMPYAVQATAFWAIEYAYNQGWQLPGHMVPPYDEFANRWGNSDFTVYVKLLENQSDAALNAAPLVIQQDAEAAFLQIARLEQEFWQMAFST